MPRPIDVDVSRQMSVPVQAVWDVLVDLGRLPEWLQFAAAVQNVSGPAAPGATYTVKTPRSYEPTTHWEITEVEPNARQLHTSEMPIVAGVRSELLLTPGADGVSVRAHWTGTPKGIMGRLMRGTMQKRITENWERSLEALERLADRASDVLPGERAG
jgi:uncharacterized protein YndB with AHSA1/START domain